MQLKNGVNRAHFYLVTMIIFLTPVFSAAAKRKAAREAKKSTEVKDGEEGAGEGVQTFL